MEAVQQYFDYRVYCICGIPRVTVAGLPNEPYVDNEAERLGLRRMHLKVVAKGLE